MWCVQHTYTQCAILNCYDCLVVGFLFTRCDLKEILSKGHNKSFLILAINCTVDFLCAVYFCTTLFSET